MLKKDNMKIFSPYPNPVNDILNIDIYMPNRDYVKIIIYDELGKEENVLYDGIMEKGVNKLIVDVSKLSKVMYICKIIYRDNISYYKIIKQ
jgi:hypothetical protein